MNTFTQQLEYYFDIFSLIVYLIDWFRLYNSLIIKYLIIVELIAYCNMSINCHGWEAGGGGVEYFDIERIMYLSF